MYYIREPGIAQKYIYNLHITVIYAPEVYNHDAY